MSADGIDKDKIVVILLMDNRRENEASRRGKRGKGKCICTEIYG